MVERKIFRELLEPGEAWNRFASHIKFGVETEEVPLHDALGRVLGVNVISPIDIPPFDRVSMDGYAVRSKDILLASEDNPVTLSVIGGIKAGHVFEGDYEESSCVEVSTGAPMPHGYDSVVMVEYTEREGDLVKIYRPTTPTENVMSAGTDIKTGELVLSKYITLTSRELAVLAAMGFSSVPVIRRPRVGIFSTGDEVVRAGALLLPGKIYDINMTSIFTSVMENGGEPHDLGIIPDNYEDLHKTLGNALGQYDLIIVSGGTSAGMGDMLYKVIDELGEPGLLVHGVKVKPGKPTILAVCDGTPVIGLPGYPASALSIVQLFVLPFLRLSLGTNSHSSPNIRRAVLRQRLRSTPGRHEFKPVNLVTVEGETIAFPVPGGSGAITSVGLADGFVEIPEGTSFVDSGVDIDVLLISPGITPVDVQVVGLHDSGVNSLIAEFHEKYPSWRTRFIGTSSSAGVISLRRGECHFASVLNFQEDDELEEYLTLSRDYGFYSRKGVHVSSLREVMEGGYRFVGYPPGTSRYDQIRRMLRDEGLEEQDVIGVDTASRTLSSALGHIRQNRADVCFGERVDCGEDIEFHSVGRETVSIVGRKMAKRSPAEVDFIEFLRGSS